MALRYELLWLSCLSFKNSLWCRSPLASLALMNKSFAQEVKQLVESGIGVPLGANGPGFHDFSIVIATWLMTGCMGVNSMLTYMYTSGSSRYLLCRRAPSAVREAAVHRQRRHRPSTRGHTT